MSTKDTPQKNGQILAMEIRYERDVVLVRQQARQVAELLGFSAHDQTRIATAVSEVCRNTFQHAGGGQVNFSVEGATASQRFLIRIRDRGPGIADVPALMAGQAGAGQGLAAARRLVDIFDLDSTPGQGTTVWLGKYFPAGIPPISPADLARIGRRVQAAPQDPFEELRRQNRELIRVMEELHANQERLTQLNRELEETNRGVLALYAELEERADQLRQAAELKSRFLSYMSHEFRTPLNAILNLSHILLQRMDGELSPEQEKQVTFIRQSAADLTELVNDLLSLARIEAGKLTVSPVLFNVDQLFGTLRGMMRPLETNPAVELIFEPPDGLPPLSTDEGKVAQILRNLISNGLKYTPEGEVRVAAVLDPAGTVVRFTVTDTGIGIAQQDQERIFEDFTRLETSLRHRPEGIGLGLALSRRLARLLGGELTVSSEAGRGSTFTALIPRVFIDPPSPVAAGPETGQPKPVAARGRVLLIDDEAAVRYAFRKLLSGSGYEVSEAANGTEGQRRAAEEQPQVIILDLGMPGQNGFETLQQLKADPATREIPVIIYTAQELADEERRRLAASGAVILAKNCAAEEMIFQINATLGRPGKAGEG